MDYKALGFKAGLEIHQQLDTLKLFCACPSNLQDVGGAPFRRRLRPTQSELGEVDAAALEEAKRDLSFLYEPAGTCLVEADEEPPHAANRQALETALILALLLDAKIVDEVHFMRKIVIDGSNTTGFQRSALVATDGRLEVEGNPFGIPSILVEEDAARKVEEREGEVVYRLDRLGIPLIEIATTPDVRTPEEARLVALHIGNLLRATRRVKRGIGTIREDVNVSIAAGSRTEIKGVQELPLLATYVEKEVARQAALVEVAASLRERGASVGPVADVTETLQASASRVVSAALHRGGRVLGLPLHGFSGTLAGKLGPELATHARIAGVGGLFHSDELPNYGITAQEVAAVRSTLGLGAVDAFALVADDARRAREALDLAAARARTALQGVPPETRDPRPDGTTVYSRPLPGRARMYPETDVPPIRITTDWLDRLRATLPELPGPKIARLVREYGIHEQPARQLVDEGWDLEFEALARGHADAKLVSAVLLYDLTQVRREGLPVETLDVARLGGLFALLREGRFAKEAIPAILREMALRGVDAATAAESLGAQSLSREDVEKEIEALLAAKRELLAERGEAAASALMGLAMERLRGRADGKVVSEVLRERLRAAVTRK